MGRGLGSRARGARVPGLATTSSGFAFTLGRRDGGTLDEMVDHARALDQATELPVSVDLENGYGPDPEDAATAILRAAEAGAVGGSIEDYDRAGFLYPPERAAERIAAAVEAARTLASPFTLTARAENHIRGNPDLRDTITVSRRSREAGADVLFAPGLQDIEDIRAVCGSVDRPVNVLGRPGLTFEESWRRRAARESRWLAHVGRRQGVHRRGDRDRPAAGPVGPGREGSAGRVARALVGEDQEAEGTEHARVETVQRDESVAGDRDHGQAGRDELASLDVLRVERERRLAVGLVSTRRRRPGRAETTA